MCSQARAGGRVSCARKAARRYDSVTRLCWAGQVTRCTCWFKQTGGCETCRQVGSDEVLRWRCGLVLGFLVLLTARSLILDIVPRTNVSSNLITKRPDCSTSDRKERMACENPTHVPISIPSHVRKIAGRNTHTHTHSSQASIQKQPSSQIAPQINMWPVRRSARSCRDPCVDPACKWISHVCAQCSFHMPEFFRKVFC